MVLWSPKYGEKSLSGLTPSVCDLPVEQKNKPVLKLPASFERLLSVAIHSRATDIWLTSARVSG